MLGSKGKLVIGLSVTAFALACGSEVREVDDGHGGTAGNPSTANGSTGGVSAQGGSTSVAQGGSGAGSECVAASGEVRPQPADCVTACEIIFCCAAPRCPGLIAADEAAYLPRCQSDCEAVTALTAVVNGENCDTTVMTLRNASPSFVDACDNGP